MNRRELLGYFGIGTVIAPVIGGVAEASAAAKLIEVPKIELVSVKPGPAGAPLDMRHVKSITVTFENNDGSRRSMQSWRIQELDGAIKPGRSMVVDLRVLSNQSNQVATSPLSYRREASVLATAVLL